MRETSPDIQRSRQDYRRGAVEYTTSLQKEKKDFENQRESKKGGKAPITQYMGVKWARQGRVYMMLGWAHDCFGNSQEGFELNCSKTGSSRL